MPFARHRTICAFELRESGEKGSLFVTSRHHRRASLFMILFQILTLVAFVLLWLRHRMKWVGDLICGVGISISIAFLLALLRLRTTTWELRTDREKKWVMLSERRLFGTLTERWKLGADRVQEIVFSRGVPPSVVVVLAEGRQLVVDQGLQEEELGRLARHLAEALGRPLRES
jgi:hypothetical protein